MCVNRFLTCGAPKGKEVPDDAFKRSCGNLSRVSGPQSFKTSFGNMTMFACMVWARLVLLNYFCCQLSNHLCCTMSAGSSSFRSSGPMPWDIPEDDLSSDEELTVEGDRGKAAQEFIDLLLLLYTSSQISAQHFAVLCYYAHWGGLSHVGEFAHPPGKPSGHYQRHLGKVLGFDEIKARFYSLDVVGAKPGQANRSVLSIPARPPHEVVEAETSHTDDTSLIKLMEAKQGNLLPPSYHTHPLVVNHPDDAVMPWGLYLDGVPYSNTDTCLAIWLINLLTGGRTLLTLMRKKCSCSCGCRGWCSWFELLSFLKWAFSAMGHKMWPTARHDGQVWKDSDHERKMKGGQPLRYRHALIRIKGDWQEFCERFGFPTWQSGTRPCLCCVGYGEGLYQFDGVSLAGLPWRKTSDIDIDRACSRCEFLFIWRRRRTGRLWLSFYIMTDGLKDRTVVLLKALSRVLAYLLTTG